MQYIRQFDGIRFIAIALVLVHHFAKNIGEKISGGYYGVELFFVLSGFLITRILYDSQGTTGSIYKKFIGRRALRIFPIYYLFLLVMYLAGEYSARKYMLPLSTYVFNYTIAAKNLSGIPFIHVWSLCVEEQFYLVWPFLILFTRQRFRMLLITLSGIILLCWIQMVFRVIPMAPLFNSYGLFPRAYALALGGLVALACRQNPDPPSWMKNKLLEILSIAVLGIVLVFPNPAMYVLAPCITAFLLAKIYYHQLQLKYLDAFLQKKWVMYLGRISYGIYLYHIPVTVYFAKYIFTPIIWKKIPFEQLGPMTELSKMEGLFKFILFTILSIGVAHLSYQLIEKRLLKLKDRWFATSPKTKEAVA